MIRLMEDVAVTVLRRDWGQGTLLMGDGLSSLAQTHLLDAKDVSFDSGLVVLTQTCDVLSTTKHRLLLAPVRKFDAQIVKEALKGKRPTLIPIPVAASGSRFDGHLIDTTYAFSIDKDELNHIEHQIQTIPLFDFNEVQAVTQFANRIARVFTRFPFPDELHDFFQRLKAKVQSKNGKLASPFGNVLDMVRYIRVGCPNWNSPNREITLYVIIDADFIMPVDDLSEYDETRIRGIGVRSLESMAFNDVLGLIAGNRDDVYALTLLWEAFADHFAEGVWGAAIPNEEVHDVDVQCVSEDEFSIHQFDNTLSLDLETLSYAAIG